MEAIVFSLGENTRWQASSYNVDSPNMVFLGVCHSEWKLQSGHLSGEVSHRYCLWFSYSSEVVTTRLVFRRYSSGILFSMSSLQVPANHMPVCAMTLEHDQSASQENASYAMRTARRLLTEAHQTTFPESRQLGRNATVMDMILDHRLLIKVADLPADACGRMSSPSSAAEPRTQMSGRC
jgi:hypothetical protein